MNVRKLFYLLVSVLCLQSVSATDFTVPRLSPLPVKVEKQKIPLGGNWQFNPSPERKCYQLEKYRSARRMGNARL